MGDIKPDEVVGCPQIIVVLHFSKEHNGFISVFEYISRLMNPPSNLIEKLDLLDKGLKKKAKNPVIEERDNFSSGFFFDIHICYTHCNICRCNKGNFYVRINKTI